MITIRQCRLGSLVRNTIRVDRLCTHYLKLRRCDVDRDAFIDALERTARELF